jgi:pimeloyl-ACP methyl ester carboxylesterase
MSTEGTDARKPLALLIPGLDGTGRFYYRQIDALSGRYRVLPWHFKDRDSFDFCELTSELGEGTAGEEPNSMLVVGESFGGPVALHFVLAYPERVRALALINTFPAYKRKVRIRLACRLAPMLRWPVVGAAKNFIAEKILTREGILEQDRRRYHEIVRLVYPPAYVRRLELVRDVALRERLGEIAVPTYIFASGRDKVVPSLSEGRYMADRIPGAKLFVFPRAGHALLLTPGFLLADYL